MTDDRALVASSIDPDISAAMTVYERLEPLKGALGLGNLTVGEMQLFAMVALHTGLDPFTRQIYAIKRGSKVTHQTGIDGYRSSAERTGQYRGSDPATFEPCTDCTDSGSPAVHPRKAIVTVFRAYPDGIRGQAGEALWHELKPKHTKREYGFDDDMWWQMPYNQLAKCAEANGLRKAFPRVLGGVYIADEMQQADQREAPPERPKGETLAELARSRREAVMAVSAPETAVEAVVVEEVAAESTPAASCGVASPYDGAVPCHLDVGHPGLHRNGERESWS